MADNGAELIRTERGRQITKGYDEAHDDGHSEGELCLAAICYAAPDRAYVMTRNDNEAFTFEDPWPWEEDADNRRNDNGVILSNSLNHQDIDDRIHRLTIAGAFIAAEIDRLLRMREVTA